MTAARIIIPDCIYLLYFSHGTRNFIYNASNLPDNRAPRLHLLNSGLQTLTPDSGLQSPVSRLELQLTSPFTLSSLRLVCPFFCCLSEMHKNQIIFLFFICRWSLLPPVSSSFSSSCSSCPVSLSFNCSFF